MDRINGADTIDIGGGRRGFRDENLVTGTAGTVVTALHLNSMQEEILKVITEAGLVPSDADWTQLWQALQILGLASDSRSRRWLAVNSMTLSSAPGAPAAGDAYLIPTGATGIWATNVGKIAQWSGAVWTYLTPPDGHGISLPDGRVFERIGGTYVEKLALDVQSGKWNYAVAGGTANALTANFTPALARAAGTTIRVRIAADNTGPATLNGVGIKWPLPVNGDVNAGDLKTGDIVTLIDDGTYYRLVPTVGMMDSRYSKLTPPPATTFYVVGPTGNDGNTGLAATAAQGFATIAGAIATLNSRYSTLSRITLNVSAGTYAGFSVDAGNIRSWRINGAGVTSTIIDASSTAVNGGRALLINGTDVIIQNADWKAFNECVGVSPQGGVLEVAGANNFEMASAGSYGINAAGGQIGVYGNVKFSGSGIACIAATSGAIRLGYTDGITTRNVAFEWAAGTTVSSGNVMATDSGSIMAFPSAVFQDGFPTGKKYDVRLNGTVNTQGSGVNFFAGTVAGASATGGQYV